MRLLDFEAQRGSDGRVRAGVWDRVCVPGNDEKDGMSSEFSLETLSQMVDNFVERGDLVPLDYNHQSQHAAQNGQPAPALAFYGALAVVWEGKLHKVGYARGLDAQTVGGDKLDLSRPGLWALRTEVTELGDQLLMNFRLLSPTFTTEGTKRDGTPIGYQLIAVAATNTPWQAATELTFDAPDPTGTASTAGATNAVSPAADKEKGMNPELLAKLGLAEGCSPEEMHAAFAKYMEDAESMKAKMAAPPPAEMDKADGDEDEKKKMEKADDKADDAKMATMAAALRATQARLEKFERREAEREAAAKAEAEKRFEALADQAVAGGYDKEQRGNLIKFARVDYDAARATVAHLLPKAGAPSHLFDRLTSMGAPAGHGKSTREEAGSLEPRKVRSMGVTFVEDDSHFADEIKRVAESKDPIVMEKVNKYLPEFQRTEPFYRLMAAEKIVRAERPELAKSAE